MYTLDTGHTAGYRSLVTIRLDFDLVWESLFGYRRGVIDYLMQQLQAPNTLGKT